MLQVDDEMRQNPNILLLNLLFFGITATNSRERTGELAIDDPGLLFGRRYNTAGLFPVVR